MPVEIEAWRVLCRTPDLSAALERLLPHLAEHMGAGGALLRRLDGAAQRVDTVAAAGPGLSALPARSPLPPGGLHALAAWARRRAPISDREPAHRDLLSMLVPAGAAPGWVAGPLLAAEGDEPLGAILLSGAGPRAADGLRPLLEPFATALETEGRIRELTRLRDRFEADRGALLSRLQRSDIADAIVGSEGGLRQVMRKVEQVAGTEAPVLLLGETGSGKEVVARAIHAASRRAAGPMLKVNCGAVPPGLVDSELFGHERGSFTGADERRRGWFERADGGTLFLDEVGELPLAAQVRLLRVLQDGTLVRVGGQATVNVDVRVVAATHRDLAAMTREGTFREDLWYRIGVFPISIPPLRERAEDIPTLAAHFAWRAGKRLGGAPLTPSPEDVRLLLEYAWPGNVRELAAVVERAAILGDGRRLDVAAALGAAPPRRPAGPVEEPGEVLPLDEAVVRAIEAALARAGGRVEGEGGAADLLRVDPGTLRSRMRRLGVDWARFRRGAPR